ncbi:prepilin-type N-terminal cleavage/methylation domain-containing protein [Desulfosporosinus orientis DSM 765]|uniref:Prepilin-type N-terminal cleavage/methylation domain-containing protein n=1 Tax=Desulfosporosinus orientis (strain ATCC 19365 / DSM 765 / NCIMB 8382 / VKM B-1628 / Singapore I) TaxID=768706 RepID=G7W842_DESOD|nr:prepilin-type N-terminal cleavage/methylation domain-containing protein [Desulfosporosinus orientis]AET66688.1 prepilin-type N-terminal cleavage/methylation domain-containing protein [Desulfosporosinus orientis DSM 765]
MNYLKRDKGFTLLEVLAVIIIIAGLAAIAIPKLVSSTANARQKADVATAHQVKAALDRYQLENGKYPDLTVSDDGEVTCTGFIPQYISKLDKSTTQQIAEGKEGFGLASLVEDEFNYVIPEDDEGESPSNLIMIYMSDDDMAAEVRAYNENLSEILWTSAN